MPEKLSHPYKGLPKYSFWKSAVAEAGLDDFDPVIRAPFTIARTEPVAAAGSCFAQHIARYLLASGFNYLQTEPPKSPGEPVFSARFGNIYTARQLRQLFLRAYGLYRPSDSAWLGKNGKYIDPFRPQMEPDGFATPEDVQAARLQHFTAVRRVFETCRIFIFTLGLTEAWLAPDGAALPVPPGAVAEEANAGPYTFHNFTVGEIVDEMTQFLRDLRDVNPQVRVILTVSPVPLIATYEDRHILLSNTYSKAALRVAAEELVRAHDFAAYFPSYEIITSPLSRSSYFEPDLRSVTETGVSRVMAIFSKHFLDGRAEAGVAKPAPPPVQQVAPVTNQGAEERELDETMRRRFEEIQNILCDEELLAREAGQ
jgi:hypothetical protein